MSTRNQDVFLGAGFGVALLQREIDSAVFDDPAALVGEVDDAAFTLEEQKVLGAGDGEGGVGFFRAGGDFGADGAD